MLLKEKSSLLVLRGGELFNTVNRVGDVSTVIIRLMELGTPTISFRLVVSTGLMPIRTCECAVATVTTISRCNTQPLVYLKNLLRAMPAVRLI